MLLASHSSNLSPPSTKHHSFRVSWEDSLPKMKNLLHEVWKKKKKKRRCVKGNPKEDHPLRSLVQFINNIKTQLQSSHVTALEFRAWIRGNVAGSWGSPVTQSRQQPPSCLAQLRRSACRWPLLKRIWWLSVTHTRSRVRQHGDLPPSPCFPGHCNQTGEQYPLFLLKDNLPPSIITSRCG